MRSRSPPIFDVWTDGRPSRARRERRRRRTCGYFLLRDCRKKKPRRNKRTKNIIKYLFFLKKKCRFLLCTKKHTNDSQQVISNRIQLTFYMYKLIFASPLMSPVFVKLGGWTEGRGHKVFVHLLASSCFHPACKNKKRKCVGGGGGGGLARKSFKVRNF